MRVPKHSASPWRSSLLRIWKVCASLSSMAFCQPIFQVGPDVFLCLCETTCMSLRDVCSCKGQCSALIDMRDQDQPFMHLPAPYTLLLTHTHTHTHTHMNTHLYTTLTPSIPPCIIHIWTHTPSHCIPVLSIIEHVLPFFLFPFSNIFVFWKLQKHHHTLLSLLV